MVAECLEICRQIMGNVWPVISLDGMKEKEAAQYFTKL